MTGLTLKELTFSLATGGAHRRTAGNGWIAPAMEQDVSFYRIHAESLIHAKSLER